VLYSVRKPFVIGRKNFLFANTARGTKASAVMYSLVETAKENGLNPFNYLTWMLKNGPKLTVIQHPELARQLLPENFQDSDIEAEYLNTPYTIDQT